MFKLVSVSTPEEVYTFIGGRKYTVGRKLADIALANDTSVSRNHAEIEVDHPRANLENPSLRPTLNVTDVGSKFGTYVCQGGDNDLRQCNMRETESLVGGDKIRFGRQWNEFSVEYTPLVVTPSTLTREETESLRENVWKLGGHCARDWVPECDFVVMNAVTLTTKAVSALLSGKHIVTPDYFRELLVSFETGTYTKTTVDPKDFEPPFAEREIPVMNINLQPDPGRAHLFEGKIFVVANSKQRKKVGATIAAGGGVCKLASECSAEVLKSRDTLFVQPGPDVIIQEISSAINTYRSQKKRLIMESEISLAALYGSTAKHCNPFGSLADQIFPPMSTQTQHQNTPSRAQILVPETQSPLNKSAVDTRTRNVVEESMNISLDAEAEFADRGDRDIKPDTRVFHDARPGPSKRAKSSVEEDSDLPSAKRRYESDTAFPYESEPAAKKRAKGGTTIAKPEMEDRTQRTLGALFKFSDDEDEDGDNEIPPTLPESRRGQTDQTNGNHRDTVVSSTTNLIPPGGNELVDFVPGTPEGSDEEVVEELPGLRLSSDARAGTKRKMDDEDISMLPTAKIPTFAQLPTMPVSEPTTSRRTRGTPQKEAVSSSSQSKLPTKQSNLSQWLQQGGKRKQANNGEVKVETQKKIKTEALEEEDEVPRKLKELNLKTEPEDEDIKGIAPAPVKVTSMIKQERLNESSKYVASSGVPNFKKFRKVQSFGADTSVNCSRVQRTFITVAPRNITDADIESYENSHSQVPARETSPDFSVPVPAAPAVAKKGAKKSKKNGSSSSSSSSSRNTHESIVVDVDVDLDAINTPSQRLRNDEPEYDPSDGLFDF